MIDLLGTKEIGNNCVKVQNVFSKHFVDFLYEDCKKQFEYNLGSSITWDESNEYKPALVEDADILISNCITDCHGLRILGKELKNDLVFPYSIRNWNIFCVKMQNIMFEYCDKFNLDKSQLAPHSCWVERSSTSKYKFLSKRINLIDDKHINLIDDTDDWLNTWLGVDKISHYRILYFLTTSDSKKYGLGVRYNNLIVTLPAENNSLYIIPSIDSEYYTQYPTNSDETMILMFDWYLHPKGHELLPAWKFPNKYNFEVYKRYVEDAIERNNFTNSFQKSLYKHYLMLFKNELKTKLAYKK